MVFHDGELEVIWLLSWSGYNGKDVFFSFVTHSRVGACYLHPSARAILLHKDWCNANNSVAGGEGV